MLSVGIFRFLCFCLTSFHSHEFKVVLFLTSGLQHVKNPYKGILGFKRLKYALSEKRSEEFAIQGPVWKGGLEEREMTYNKL